MSLAVAAAAIGYRLPRLGLRPPTAGDELLVETGEQLNHLLFVPLRSVAERLADLPL